MPACKKPVDTPTDLTHVTGLLVACRPHGRARALVCASQHPLLPERGEQIQTSFSVSFRFVLIFSRFPFFNSFPLTHAPGRRPPTRLTPPPAPFQPRLLFCSCHSCLAGTWTDATGWGKSGLAPS